MKALSQALEIHLFLVNHAMGGSKDEMQEWKCPKEFPQSVAILSMDESVKIQLLAYMI